MIGQKDFIISEVKRILGAKFIPFQTNALLLLSRDELELIKETTLRAILNGTVEYSKVGEAVSETRTYARSLVMNHIKKCRELNGNLVYSTVGGQTTAAKATPLAPKGIVVLALSVELQEYIKSLV